MTDRPTPNEAMYVARTPASQAQFMRARKTLPRGVASRAKFIRPHPLYVHAGRGSRIDDLDGNEYLDLHLSSGCLILGHRHPVVCEAVEHQMRRGLALGLPTALEAELAESIQLHMPHVERLRYTTTGSEATVMAARVARAFTERSRIAKFEGHFHGHAHDALFASTAHVAGSREEPLPAPESAGLVRGERDTLLLPVDDVEAAIERVAAAAPELAAVIIEPAPLNSLPTVVPTEELISRLREVTEEHGILLIFDEVFTCFRLGLGGGSAHFGVEPDLVTLGKIIGGGLPLGAFGGRADVMEATLGVADPDPERPHAVFQSGTFSGHPVSLAAGLATVTELARTDPYPVLERRTETIRAGLAEVCEGLGLLATVKSVASMIQIFFGTSGPVLDRWTVLDTDLAFQREFCLGMVCNGVFWLPGASALLSTSHSDSDAEQIVETARAVLTSQREYMTLKTRTGG